MTIVVNLTKLLLEDTAYSMLQKGLTHTVSPVISRVLGCWPHQAVQVSQCCRDQPYLHHQGYMIWYILAKGWITRLGVSQWVFWVKSKDCRVWPKFSSGDAHWTHVHKWWMSIMPKGILSRVGNSFWALTTVIAADKGNMMIVLSTADCIQTTAFHGGLDIQEGCQSYNWV